MNTATVHLHGGPLDGAVRVVPTGSDGQPAELADFDHETQDGLWYVQYRRARHDNKGWHFEATGNEKRADEE
mgnify:CR=1 FL=1